MKKGFLEFVYDFYKGMKTHEVSLAYEGEINHELMKSFTSLIQGQMDTGREGQLLKKKVYHVMVECLQNIYKHAFHTKSKTGKDLNHGILLVAKTPGSYQVVTGNVIEIERIETLVEFLDRINKMDRKELDSFYKKNLIEGQLSDKGGAGLGFIDIKRKTGQNLDYHFLPLDKEHSFFLFTSTIPRNP